MSKLKAVLPKEAGPRKPKILVFGKAGVGKTWTSLDFPNVYYIDTEGGASGSHYTEKLTASGGVYMGQEQGSLDFDTVIDQVKALATEQHHYKTLVIDSFTKLYQTFQADAAEEIGDDFGRDKKEANKPTRKLIKWLTRLDMNVILIAHEKALWGVDGKGQRNEIGVTFDAYDKMDYELDLCLNIIKAGPNRNAKIIKSRLLGFPDGDIFKWSYDEFASRYGKDIIEKDGRQLILATAEQLKEMERLVKTVQLKEGLEAKWLKAANADSWSEVDKDTIQKCIDYIYANYINQGEAA